MANTKKVVGIIISANDDIVSYNDSIPLKLNPYMDFIKRVCKGAIVITTRKSYPEVSNSMYAKEFIIVSSHPEDCPKDVKVFNNIKSALKYCNENSGSKSNIPIICGASFSKFLEENKVYDEFVRIRVDVDFGDENIVKSNIDFSHYASLKQPEEFYFSGFSYWYEAYNMRKWLDKSCPIIMNPTRLENIDSY